MNDLCLAEKLQIPFCVVVGFTRPVNKSIILSTCIGHSNKNHYNIEGFEVFTFLKVTNLGLAISFCRKCLNEAKIMYNIRILVENIMFICTSFCFATSANTFYVYQQCTYIACILLCHKVQNNCQNVSENSWNKPLSNHVQKCPLRSPRLCCYRFLLSINMNRLPENYILVSDRTKETLIKSKHLDSSKRASLWYR